MKKELKQKKAIESSMKLLFSFNLCQVNFFYKFIYFTFMFYFSLLYFISLNLFSFNIKLFNSVKLNYFVLFSLFLFC